MVGDGVWEGAALFPPPKKIENFTQK